MIYARGIAWHETKKSTIIFYADDLMALHIDPAIVVEYVKKLHGAHSDKDPLSVTRGKLCECLGTTIDFGLKRGVAVC